MNKKLSTTTNLQTGRNKDHRTERNRRAIQSKECAQRIRHIKDASAPEHSAII